jgi:hypothetical protein
MEGNTTRHMSDAATAGPSITPPAGLGGLLAQSITRHEQVFVFVAVVVFGSSAAYRAFTTPLWFDEFFTLFISRLSSLSEMLRAVPADGQPPLQHLLTHVFVRLFGESEFGVRALELSCYLAAGLLTYRIVRRHGRRRLIYLSDVSFAVRQQDFLPELSLVFDNRYTPLPVSDYATFIAIHQRFLLLASGEPRLVWVPARLSEAGWRLTPTAKSGRDVLYLAERM